MSNPVTVDFEGLADFFQTDANVIMAVVFGSSRDGVVQPGSDLDIGVLFRYAPPAGSAFLDYYSRLCDLIPEVEAVDLVTLNHANTILAFEALKGRVLQKNDAAAAAEFFSLVCREYEDVMGNLDHQRRMCAVA